MQDESEIIIWIYHEGVQMEAPVHGQERYLREKAFLNDLTQQRFSDSMLPRPVPDPSFDFYMLDKQQLEAYSAFRQRLKNEDRKP